MYLTAVDCHQTVLNKANKNLMNIRKKNTQQIPCLGTVSNKSTGGAGLTGFIALKGSHF